MDDIIDMESKDLTIIIGKFNSSKTAKILEILNMQLSKTYQLSFYYFGADENDETVYNKIEDMQRLYTICDHTTYL